MLTNRHRSVGHTCYMGFLDLMQVARVGHTRAMRRSKSPLGRSKGEVLLAPSIWIAERDARGAARLMLCLTFTGPPWGTRGPRETCGAHEGMLCLSNQENVEQMDLWNSHGFDLKQKRLFQIETEIHSKLFLVRISCFKSSQIQDLLPQKCNLRVTILLHRNSPNIYFPTIRSGIKNISTLISCCWCLSREDACQPDLSEFQDASLLKNRTRIRKFCVRIGLWKDEELRVDRWLCRAGLSLVDTFLQLATNKISQLAWNFHWEEKQTHFNEDY